MDWGSALVGLVVGILIGPAVWRVVRAGFSTEDDEAAGIIRD